MVFLERRAIKKADIAYAPSKFLSDCCRGNWRNDVHIVRPPMMLDVQSEEKPPIELPKRYFLHFGQIGTRKGSEILATALKKVWKQEPAFTMIWAGKEISGGEYECYCKKWGDYTKNILWLGPIKKAILYFILKRAEASVLPSLIDNLPNTVIESLMFKVPVIGFKGSIDELVEPGVNGELVQMGDESALADSLIKTWRRQVRWIGSGFRQSKIIRELDPTIAIDKLLRLTESGLQY